MRNEESPLAHSVKYTNKFTAQKALSPAFYHALSSFLIAHCSLKLAAVAEIQR